MEKKCRKCNVVKDVCEFHRNEKLKDSLSSTCKNCKKQYSIGFYTGGKNFDISKSWYLRWSFRHPISGILERQKNFKGGVNYYKTKEERLNILEEYKIELIKLIKKKYSPTFKGIENKEQKKREYLIQYREKNKEKLKAQVKKYQQDNKDKISEDKKRYKENNKEKTNKNSKYRWETDSLYRLKINTRRAVRNHLKQVKSKRTTEIVGMGFSEFQTYLKKEYTEDMHLDHIIPISWAINEDEVYILNHFSNFQILTAEKNLAKSNTYCKSENLKKVLSNHNDLAKLIKILERNSDKIK